MIPQFLHNQNIATCHVFFVLYVKRYCRLERGSGGRSSDAAGGWWCWWGGRLINRCCWDGNLWLDMSWQLWWWWGSWVGGDGWAVFKKGASWGGEGWGAKLYLSLSRHVQTGAKMSLSRHFAYVGKYHEDNLGDMSRHVSRHIHLRWGARELKRNSKLETLPYCDKLQLQ